MNKEYNELNTGRDAGFKKAFLKRSWLTSILLMIAVGQFSYGQIALPYFENFSTIAAANGFPTVAGGAWTRTGTTGTQPTYIANPGAPTYNRSGNGDQKFIAFRYGITNAVFAVGPFTLVGGTTYNVSALYKADGLNGFGPLQLTYGTGTTNALQQNTIVSIPANITNAAFQTIGGTFTPATSGSYYLGIRCTANSTPWYLTMDDFSVSAAAACSGTPTPGNTIASANPFCSGSTVTLSLQNATPGGGVTYQWYNSAGLIAGATNSTYTTPALTANNTYYAAVTCGANTGNSNPIALTLSPFTNCYPANYASNPADEDISNVTVGSLNNSSSNCTVAAAGAGSIAGRYSNFKAVPAPNLEQSSTVGFSLTMTSCGVTAYENFFQVYIDYNQDGDFADAGEQVYVQPTAPDVLAQTVTGTFVVPAGALLGTTGMRIVNIELTPSSTTNYSSVAYTYGETEDYLVNIVPPAACPAPTGLSVTGVTSSGATLNWNASAGTPLSYEWEIRTSGAGGSGGTGLVDSGSVAAPTTTASSSTLAASTVYTAYVRAFCGGTDYSSWIASATFATPCNATTVLPSTEGFEGTAPCWTVAPITGNNWALYTSILTTEVPNAHTGTKLAGIAWQSGVNTDALLISPLYDISANGSAQTRVKVWIYRALNGLSTDRITVSINTAPNQTGGTTILDIPRLNTLAPTVASAGWYEYIANVPTSYNASTFYVVMRGNVQGGGSNYSLGLDDFTLELAPPTVASFTPGNICASGTDAERTVTISGTSFTGTTAVSVNGTAVQSFIVDSATQITAVVSSASTSGTISVTNGGGTASSVGSLSIYSDYPFYADTDGDTFGAGSAVNLCSVDGATAPAGYSVNNTDCNDNDNTVYQDDQLYTDVDGDGYNAGDLGIVCYGATIPAGTSLTTLGTDCNDNDNTVYQDDQLYTDSDGDGYDAGDLGVVCYGATLPAGTSLTTLGPDCNDNDNTVFQDDQLYTDADGDGYDAGNLGVVCYGATLPVGTSLTTLGTDCNDSAAAVNPGQSEILYNGVDDNCDGNLDEGNQLTTQIVAGQCGTTLPTIGANIAAVSKQNTTMYRFEVTNTTTTVIQSIDKTTPYFNLTQLASYDYETTYSIRVMLQRNGVWLGYYGAACLISSPAITAANGGTAAQINPSQCGIVLPSINTLIATSSTAGVTGYRFKVTNITDPSAPNQVQILDRSTHWFNLPMLTSYHYGTTYIIEVALKTTGAYSAYGNACQISSPAVPSINSCGQSIPTPATYIYTTSLAKVTSYRFEITNLVTNQVTTLDRSQNWFTFNMVPGFAPATLYGVRVAVMTSGYYSLFSDACEITSPGFARPEGPKADTTEKGVAFAAVAYPNPFAENFMIDVKTSSEAAINIKVYDMTGRILNVMTVDANEMESQQIGNNYPAGVYNVIVTQGDEVKTLRVVKR